MISCFPNRLMRSCSVTRLVTGKLRFTYYLGWSSLVTSFDSQIIFGSPCQLLVSFSPSPEPPLTNSPCWLQGVPIHICFKKIGLICTKADMEASHDHGVAKSTLQNTATPMDAVMHVETSAKTSAKSVLIAFQVS